jgi:hypothetical protein
MEQRWLSAAWTWMFFVYALAALPLLVVAGTFLLGGQP